jgi:acetolactate synthase-1/3 small subunit
VGETEDPTVSRMTIVADGDERVLEQVEKQLNKLIDVIKLTDITEEEHVNRELILIKVSSPDAQTRQEIMQIVDVFRARIVDIGRDALIIEATGDQEKINAIQSALKPFGIKELARTGKIAMVRAPK